MLQLAKAVYTLNMWLFGLGLMVAMGGAVLSNITRKYLSSRSYSCCKCGYLLVGQVDAMCSECGMTNHYSQFIEIRDRKMKRYAMILNWVIVLGIVLSIFALTEDLQMPRAE